MANELFNSQLPFDSDRGLNFNRGFDVEMQEIKFLFQRIERRFYKRRFRETEMLGKSSIELYLQRNRFPRHQLLHQPFQPLIPITNQIKLLLHIQYPIILILNLPLKTINLIMRHHKLPLDLTIITLLTLQHNHITLILMLLQFLQHYFLLTPFTSFLHILTTFDMVGVLLVLDFFLTSVLRVDTFDNEGLE